MLLSQTIQQVNVLFCISLLFFWSVHFSHQLDISSVSTIYTLTLGWSYSLAFTRSILMSTWILLAPLGGLIFQASNVNFMFYWNLFLFSCSIHAKIYWNTTSSPAFVVTFVGHDNFWVTVFHEIFFKTIFDNFWRTWHF